MAKSCLIVEDNPIHRKIVYEILEPLDFDIQEAENGIQAIVLCSQKMPDLIILDWMMEDANGIEFITGLRTMEDGDKPYVVMCTAKDRKNNMANAVEAGVDQYLTKPFDPQTLEVILLEGGLIKHEQL